MKPIVFLAYLTILTTEIRTHQVPTVYDVLSLVYKLCATNELQVETKVGCLEERLAKKVTPAFQQCFRGVLTEAGVNKNNQTLHVERLITTLCFQSTFVPQWLTKYHKAPTPLTTVISLTALGRMACVIGEIQRPLVVWKLAFSDKS
ncbi:uncharacterized protein LOC143253434 isoform X2 [Tachypleus tridentatus]|uniref:uncharacterized protein LOC143253434 isoform X2 n=1 Tax=Tachypleus tridentatus TaxID=6853 RepID=UPI003FD4DD99